MIDLQSVGHVPDPLSAKVVHIGDNDDLMAPLNEALSKLVAVGLHTSELRGHKVGTNADTILGGALHKPFYVLVIILVKIVMPLYRLLLIGIYSERLIHLCQHVLLPQMPFHVRRFYGDAILVMLDSVFIVRL